MGGQQVLNRFVHQALEPLKPLRSAVFLLLFMYKKIVDIYFLSNITRAPAAA